MSLLCCRFVPSNALAVLKKSRSLIVLAGAVIVSACTTGSGAIFAAAQGAISGSQAKVIAAPLDPRFRYLRLTAFGQTVYPVLGFVDGNVDVWYSSSGEVIRLRNGRVSETAGLPTDWRDVVALNAPQWSGLATQPTGYQRSRDVLPGYHFALVDEVKVRSIDAPSSTALAGVAPSKLQWFEEVSITNDDRLGLPVARFGVDMSVTPPKVVYSEQCLSNTLCLQMQEWSAAQQSALHEKAIKP